MDLFSEHFKGDINANIAKILSFNIEASVHQLHNADRDSKGYISKARSLSFNLKKNEVLQNNSNFKKIFFCTLLFINNSVFVTTLLCSQRLRMDIIQVTYLLTYIYIHIYIPYNDYICRVWYKPAMLPTCHRLTWQQLT